MSSKTKPLDTLQLRTPTPKIQKQVFVKFALLLGLMFGYFIYLTLQYDLLTGGVAALLTWSFFVLCTPIADAGFLLDFPLRLLFGIRMVVSEIAVWTAAILINGCVTIFAVHFYDTTLITQLLHQVITTPFPYWGIILLSGLGTFLSIRFGDEILDVLHQKDRDIFHSHHFKHELILFAFFIIIIFGYYSLVSSLGIDVSQ